MSEVPFALLPYQQAWIADRHRVKVCEKSRRIGLSWCEAAEDALLASTAGSEGMDVWYIGYNKDMAVEYINDCAHWVGQYSLAASACEEIVVEDEDKSILAFRIRFSSGYRVTALSSRPSNLRGKQGKVVIDEAAFHNDLPGLLKAALAILMWGGRVCVISTHFGEANDFNGLINDVRIGKLPGKTYSLHRITLDDALCDGLYRRICLRLGTEWTAEGEAEWRDEMVASYGDAADEELFCIPSKGTGTFLPRAVVEACMDQALPVLRLACRPEFVDLSDEARREEIDAFCRATLLPHLEKLDPNTPTAFGQDFGRTGDLSVIFPLVESSGLSWRAPFLLELRNVPFTAQEQVLFFIGDRLPRLRGGALDAGGNGAYLAERARQRYGAWRIAEIKLSQEWYRDNMPRYKAAFEDRQITMPASQDVLDDHGLVRMEKGVAHVPQGARTRGRDGGQRHGDTAIAGSLAWFAATKIQGNTGILDYYKELCREEQMKMLGVDEKEMARIEEKLRESGLLEMWDSAAAEDVLNKLKALGRL